ncbi:hypothetical protein OROGR_002736 [Orobanche gracilis]
MRKPPTSPPPPPPHHTQTPPPSMKTRGSREILQKSQQQQKEDMGKNTRKAKVTVDVAVMDVSQSYLGVRTRAKTLALQRLQTTAAVALPPSKSDACYLELRSRRLEKHMQLQSSRIAGDGCVWEIGSREEFLRSGSGSGSIEGEDSEIEGLFGENNLDSEAGENGSLRKKFVNESIIEVFPYQKSRSFQFVSAAKSAIFLLRAQSERLVYKGEKRVLIGIFQCRGTRESTPCSLIKAADKITTPGSTSKKICSIALSQRSRTEPLTNAPSSHELDEFFNRVEQSVQRQFIERYNFDFVKNMPLPGRYEWMAVRL